MTIELTNSADTPDNVELATLGWIHRWHNTIRLHGYLAGIPPTE